MFYYFINLQNMYRDEEKLLLIFEIKALRKIY